MHGAFIVGLKELVVNRFDVSFWEEILEYAGFDPNYYPLSNQELADNKAEVLIKASLKKLNLGDRKFGEVFGNYWIKTFAREKYFAFFDAHKSSKEFINNLTELHKKLSATLTDKNPPVFEIDWQNQNTVLITYHSSRSLIHIAVGLLKALGDFYNDDISVYRVDKNLIKVFYKD
ncbi:MAG: heme NO-binding domain-containing protein [Bacteroidales bacterium]|nr:heme NO-binding domain-containing protein [Bacteroidales bacterium]